MSDKETNGYAVDTIENEGLAYAVRHYCSGSTFKDEDTAFLWDQAATALDALIRHLENETGREIEA